MFTTLSITSLRQGNLNANQEITLSSLESDIAQAKAVCVTDLPKRNLAAKFVGWFATATGLFGKSFTTNPSLIVSGQLR